MKKLLIIILFISGAAAYSQNSFRVYHFNAKEGAESAIAALADEYWGDAKFKSGGVQIERIGIGDNEWTHRVVVFGQVGNLGREEGDVEKMNGRYFSRGLIIMLKSGALLQQDVLYITKVEHLKIFLIFNYIRLDHLIHRLFKKLTTKWHLN